MHTLAIAIAIVLGLGAGGLNGAQRDRADQLISLFENGTPEIQYCSIEALGDGRGYTAGRAGFTSATGDLLDVGERYTRAVPGNALEPLLPRLRAAAAAKSGSTKGLEALPDAWRASCRDERHRAVQDELVDEEYYGPAVARGRRLGLRRALSLAALYDTEVQHGGGDDPDGTPALVRRATRRAGGSPRRGGVSESRWLRAFLAVRRADLLDADDPDTRAVWRESVGRVDAFRYLLRTGQWQLAAPVRLRTRDYRVDLP